MKRAASWNAGSFRSKTRVRCSSATAGRPAPSQITPRANAIMQMRSFKPWVSPSSRPRRPAVPRRCLTPQAAKGGARDQRARSATKTARPPRRAGRTRPPASQPRPSCPGRSPPIPASQAPARGAPNRPCARSCAVALSEEPGSRHRGHRSRVPPCPPGTPRQRSAHLPMLRSPPSAQTQPDPSERVLPSPRSQRGAGASPAPAAARPRPPRDPGPARPRSERQHRSSGTEQKVKREVAVPGISGHLSCIDERPRLARIAGDSVRERATQPRQPRALLTVRIQLLGLAHQPLQQIRLAAPQTPARLP